MSKYFQSFGKIGNCSKDFKQVNFLFCNMYKLYNSYFVFWEMLVILYILYLYWFLYRFHKPEHVLCFEQPSIETVKRIESKVPQTPGDHPPRDRVFV